MVNGAISGLVCITPASGYVTTLGAFFIGLIGGVACYGGSQIKYFFKIDDSLDAFGVHAVGGFVGTIVTAFFANKNVGGEDGIFYTNTATGGRQLAKQLYAVVVVSCWAGFASFVILKILELVMGGLRVSEAVEKNADKLVLREDAHPNTEIPLPQMPGIHPDPLHHDI